MEEILVIHFSLRTSQVSKWSLDPSLGVELQGKHPLSDSVFGVSPSHYPWIELMQSCEDWIEMELIACDDCPQWISLKVGDHMDSPRWDCSDVPDEVNEEVDWGADIREFLGPFSLT